RPPDEKIPHRNPKKSARAQLNVTNALVLGLADFRCQWTHSSPLCAEYDHGKMQILPTSAQPRYFLPPYPMMFCEPN
ncbi:MAG TPA: hypothetical protein PK866_01585, partial [Nitrospira sp.]|nr:hypothetical protein [Nitrospira sp.]